MTVVVAAVRVTVPVPFAAGVTDAGDKVQVIVGVAGTTEQANATDELKSLNDDTVTVEVAVPPAVTTPEAGVALNEKSLMFNTNVVVRLAVPEDPETVTV